MSEPTVTVTVDAAEAIPLLAEAAIELQGVLCIPLADLPPGSVVSITITVGSVPPPALAPAPPAPAPRRHFGSSGG